MNLPLVIKPNGVNNQFGDSICLNAMARKPIATIWAPKYFIVPYLIKGQIGVSRKWQAVFCTGAWVLSSIKWIVGRFGPGAIQGFGGGVANLITPRPAGIKQVVKPSSFDYIGTFYPNGIPVVVFGNFRDGPAIVAGFFHDFTFAVVGEIDFGSQYGGFGLG